MTHVPPVLKVTTPKLIEHTVVLDASIEKPTVRPEDAFAVGVYVLPTTGDAGGIDVKLIVCVCWLSTVTGIDPLAELVFVTLSAATVTTRYGPFAGWPFQATE